MPILGTLIKYHVTLVVAVSCYYWTTWLVKMEDNVSCSFDSDENAIITYVVIGTASFSCLCCSLTIAILLFFNKYRDSSQKLLLCLIIALLLEAILLVILGATGRPFAENDVYTTIAGFLNQQCSWYVLLAICCLTIDIYIKAVYEKVCPISFKIYIIIILVLPLLVNWIPFIGDAYGLNGVICWIRDVKYINSTECTRFQLGIIYQFACYWIPFYIAMLCIVVATLRAWIVIKRRRYAYNGIFDPTEQHNRLHVLKEIRQYQLYPLVFTLLKVFQPIRQITDAIYGHIFPLHIIHFAVFSLQGALISLTFLFQLAKQKELRIRDSVRANIVNKDNFGVTYEAIIEKNMTDSLNFQKKRD